MKQLYFCKLSLQKVNKPAETTINEPINTGVSNVSLKTIIPMKETKTNWR